jgi:DNA-binding transcriptional LysR family regulator
MPKIIQWDRQIGRRLQLRDLFVFFTVVNTGSMTKAAAQLGVSTPSVSEIIANLERALGVRLLDRSSKGTFATNYGRALLRRGEAAFDELRQGVLEIEFLSDPTTGEINIACPESIATILPPVIKAFRVQYPRVILNIEHEIFSTFAQRLRNRSADLVLMRLRQSLAGDLSFDDLNVEHLFNDELVVVAGAQSQWARRRSVDLAELAKEDWILPVRDSWGYKVVAEAFDARGLAIPKISVKTLSIHLQTSLLTDGHAITALARSVFNSYCNRLSLKMLPIVLNGPTWPVAIVTLKRRTLNPVVERFIKCTREAAKSIAGKQNATSARSAKTNASR